MAAPAILAIDQGTSATKCVLVSADGTVVARAERSVAVAYPRPGWVEQDAGALWNSVRAAAADCLAIGQGHDVVAAGFGTQRESLVAWDARTGEPVSPVISWQDGRGAAICDRLRTPGTEALIAERSGLPLDPMFSAAKAAWLLAECGPERARRGDIRLGTVDSWLLSRLADDHLTEIGNASRTQLMNVGRGVWDETLLEIFGIPRAALPEIRPSIGPFPALRGIPGLPDGTPVAAVLGDSHAALFGHGATAPGTLKATFGTGSSVMGVLPPGAMPGAGVCRTIAWQIDGIVHAAEGNIRSSGATLGWLAAILGVDVPGLIALAAQAPEGPEVLVPGFGGLGAPWWDRDAVGLFANLTLGTGRDALARAAVDSVVQQVADVVEAIVSGTGGVRTLFVDGGASRSDALMRRQADRLGCSVLRPRQPELSAIGVAHLAGLSAGLWTTETLSRVDRPRDRFDPWVPVAGTGAGSVDGGRRRWRDAVRRARGQSAAGEDR